jgi:hypothetical protein
VKMKQPKQIFVFSLDLSFFVPLALISWRLSSKSKIKVLIFSTRETKGLSKIFLKMFGELF